MCSVCGCGQGEVRIEGASVPEHGHMHVHADGTVHAHHHHHDHDHGHEHGAALEEPRIIAVERELLARNDAIAADNRRRFAQARTLALNLVSSPGAGKTTLLVETLRKFQGKRPVAVIEGDQETTRDADRIRATGTRAVQINTGRACHLDAEMVRAALPQLEPLDRAMLFIENVGNLVCPAAFDLGEAHKVVVASVTEGEDKPLKYPGMFAAACLMLVAKCDLLPHLDFDVAELIENARRINPGITVIRVSARTGEGLPSWLAWLEAAHGMQLAVE